MAVRTAAPRQRGRWDQDGDRGQIDGARPRADAAALGRGAGAVGDMVERRQRRAGLDMLGRVPPLGCACVALWQRQQQGTSVGQRGPPVARGACNKRLAAGRVPSLLSLRLRVGLSGGTRAADVIKLGSASDMVLAVGPAAGGTAPALAVLRHGEQLG